MAKRRTEYLTIDEVEDILRQPDKTTEQGLRDFCILRLMLCTGFRRAEVASLKVGNLHRANGSFYLVVLGKGGREQPIEVEDIKLLEALYKYHNDYEIPFEKEDPMFFTLSRRGGRPIQGIGPETIRRVVEKYKKLAKIPKRITPHSFRHTFITEAGKHTTDLADLRDLARHANIKTTSGYWHSKEKDRREILRKLPW